MGALADVIAQRHDEILRLWRTDAQRAASARGLDTPAFQNVMPEYIRSLGEPSSSDEQLGGRRRVLLEEHFSTRVRQGFLLPEMVEEFAILGRVIAGVARDRASAPLPSAEEIEALLSELQFAAVVVSDLYGFHMQEEEQLEKRYGRLIETVAQNALHGEEDLFDAHLREVLLLFMEAMAAESAALLLLDPESGELEKAIAAGVGADALAAVGCSPELPPFAAEAAGSEHTVFLLDTAATRLTAGATLRELGLRSLLGVRVKPRMRVLGVVYVASTHVRAFSPREVQRLTYLGQQLALHLDNARLAAELRARIAAIAKERDLREQMMSLVAHDLRGPLTAIKLRTTTLLKEAASDRAARLLEKTQYAIGRIESMLADLLDAHRLHAGHPLEARREQCDLVHITREVADELNEAHGERFQLEGEVSASLMCDADQLRRAIWNLATNAVKYGDAQGLVRIAVRCQGKYVTVSVHNQGPAISPAMQARLFEPFAQDRALQGGWGLGLTLVRGAAEAHGGTVSVVSSEAHGTTFTLALPLEHCP